MSVYRKPVLWGLIVLVPFLCASCLTMTMPKSARVDPGAPSSGTGAVDKKLVDVWELLYQANDKGEEKRPLEGTQTLIEFTNKGQVIFNRIDKENPSAVKNQTGKYSIDKGEITITDGAGNTIKWPYEVNGDTLTIRMPEVQEQPNMYWRRHR